MRKLLSLLVIALLVGVYLYAFKTIFFYVWGLAGFAAGLVLVCISIGIVGGLAKWIYEWGFAQP